MFKNIEAARNIEDTIRCGLILTEENGITLEAEFDVTFSAKLFSEDYTYLDTGVGMQKVQIDDGGIEDIIIEEVIMISQTIEGQTFKTPRISMNESFIKANEIDFKNQIEENYRG